LIVYTVAENSPRLGSPAKTPSLAFLAAPPLPPEFKSIAGTKLYLVTYNRKK
jgi:hypothetical protein